MNNKKINKILKGMLNEILQDPTEENINNYSNFVNAVATHSRIGEVACPHVGKGHCHSIEDLACPIKCREKPLSFQDLVKIQEESQGKSLSELSTESYIKEGEGEPRFLDIIINESENSAGHQDHFIGLDDGTPLGLVQSFNVSSRVGEYAINQIETICTEAELRLLQNNTELLVTVVDDRRE